MTGLEARRVELLAQLEAAPPPMPRLHANLAELYRQRVINLAEALNDEHTRQEAAEGFIQERTKGELRKLV